MDRRRRLDRRLYFFAVQPRRHRAGIGTTLVSQVERALRSAREDVARVLIVETSGTDDYEAARRFYAHRGFDQEARVREFYGPDDDKVVFWKSLLGTGQRAGPIDPVTRL